MYPYVDAFVLVESTRSHKGSLKPLYYQENLSRFAKYVDKIVHVVVDDLYATPKIEFDFVKGEQWINEKHQRNGITLGIELLASEEGGGKRGWKLEEKDVLLVSDVDEIVDMNRLEIIQSALKSNGLVIIPMDMYYYHLKNKLLERWTHAKAITYSYYLGLPMTTYPGMKGFRNFSENVRAFHSGGGLDGIFGWHLSYFGNEHMISNKLKEFAHQEFNSSIFTTPEYIKERVEKGTDILGRSDINFQRIEYSENMYLPPFPEGVEKDWNQFPFCVSPFSSSGNSNGV
jgi:beta-1,4-mannosyl-glycoprotein beta-1,4-N-acetylglucosaminyltransferase